MVTNLRKEALGQEFFGTATRLDIQESIMSLLYVAMAESAKAQLNHSPIVEDLGWQIGMVDCFLQNTKHMYHKPLRILQVNSNILK